ncbi:uncharacterized protein LOC127423880 [Myxocyprinus asiaticus]|uniref:uncharacterized protein LOC127423880 n=1 Tax=Myxocyprinus asiaticus TaxID=70543 RepID=UPI002223CC22|nr:uncharacterized protein LOC127423880 [Myxocyprinus asiaticus]
MANSRNAHVWTDRETVFMLLQLKELNILKFMDGRKTKNGEPFKKVAQRLKEAGFIRSPEQIRVRWKQLKQTYYRAKMMNGSSDTDPVMCSHAEILEELLGHRPLSTAGQNGVDIGFKSDNTSSESVQDRVQPARGSEDPAIVESDSFSENTPPERTGTPLPSTSTSFPLPEVRGPAAGKRQRETAQMESFFERMLQMQNSWIAAQCQQSQEREERLVSSIMESNNKIVSTLMEGIRSLQPSLAATSQPRPPSCAGNEYGDGCHQVCHYL